MIAYSYIELSKKDYNKFIYRIISIERFYEILKKKQFPLINPLLWDDPYECLLYKRPHILEDGTTRTLESVIKNMFGSCWTLNYNTDFGWKVYAPEKNGIQIKVKISELYDHFQFFKDDENVISFQIGKVVYLRSKELRQRISQTQKISLFGMMMNLSMFYKRYNFRHEREVRILIRLKGEINSSVEFVKFDPNKLTHSAMLDPRMGQKEITEIKTKIKSLGYQKRIFQSRLYTPPKLENIVYNSINGL